MKKRKPLRLTKKTIAAMACLILITFWIAGCEQKSPVPFPSYLIGTWVTNEPRYKDRYLEINEGEIIFGTGENKPNTFFIDSIKKGNQAAIIEWTFFCQNMEGTLFDIVIFYNSGAKTASITLKNKETIVWYKVEE